MRAWRVHEYGSYRDKLRLEEVDKPRAPDDGVVVRVAAAGVNFPDLLAIAGQYQVKAPLPFTPGIEACGEIVEVGARSRWKPGQRVIASGGWGAFAEYMVADDIGVYPVPDEMSTVDAAAFLVVYHTSYFALVYRAEMKPGETLLVHGGAGGVGTSAIQLGKALGATVIATAGSDDKLEVCRRLGADHVINYKNEDFVARVKDLTGGRGADVIYDPVGGEVFDRSLKCIAFSGRILVIGFASGRIPQVPANIVLLKNISVVGVHWGNYRFYDPDKLAPAHEALCRLYVEGKARPLIGKELPLAELPAALDAIRARESVGKIVLTAG